MRNQTRINIRSIANSASARDEVRNGRKLKIVPSVTLPDDIVMNGIRYPAEEIEKSFMTLNRTPAPLGHPMVNGKFVSARDPEGLNIGYIGAWNENVRRENGRVYLDKVIDIEVANRTDGGKAVLAAINAGEPVHTSTGLLCRLEAVSNDSEAKHIARDMAFDHDAILLNEIGAATPQDGVGMMVNGQEIDVQNCEIDWAERDLDWALSSVLDAVDRRQKASLVKGLKQKLLAMLDLDGGEETTQPQPKVNKEDDMSVTDEDFKKLQEKVDALATNQISPEALTKAIGDALSPLTQQVNALTTVNETALKAEHASLAEKVVAANMLTKDVADKADIDVLRSLAANIKSDLKAAPLTNAGFVSSGEDEFADMDLNAHMKKGA